MRHWAGHGRAPLVLLVLTLLLRMLVPQGWMPSEHSVGIRPCFPTVLASRSEPAAPAHHGATGGHEHSAYAGETAHHRSGNQQPEHQPSQPCGYAALGFALSFPPVFIQQLPAAAIVPALVPLPLATAVGRGLAAPPPPQTGPPPAS